MSIIGIDFTSTESIVYLWRNNEAELVESQPSAFGFKETEGIQVQTDAESLFGKALRNIILGAEKKCAVVAVPASMDSLNQQSILKAAAKAGLHNTKLITRTTASATAYRLEIDAEPDELDLSRSLLLNAYGRPVKIAVFDFGGRGVTVAVVGFYGENSRLLSSCTESGGGEDIIFKNFIEFLELSSSENLEKLAKECERALIKMETSRSTMIQVDSFEKVVDRKDLKSITQDVVESCLRALNTALVNAGIGKEGVQDYILMGSGGKNVVIKEAMRNFFKKPPSVFSREAVAKGACIQALNYAATLGYYVFEGGWSHAKAGGCFVKKAMFISVWKGGKFQHELSCEEEELSAVITHQRKEEEELSAVIIHQKEEKEKLSAIITNQKEEKEELSAVITNQKEEKEELSAVITNQKEEKEELSAVITNQKEEKEKLSAVITNQKEEKEELSAVITNQKEEKEELSAVITNQKEEKEELSAVITNQKEEKEKLSAVITNQKEEKEKLSAVITNQKEEKEELSAVITNQKVEKEKLSAVITNQKEEKEELSAVITNQKEEKEELSAVITNQKEEKEELSAVITNQKEEKEELSAVITNQKEEKEELSAVITNQKEEKEELSAVITNQKEEKEELSAVITNQKKEKEELSAVITNQKEEKEELSAVITHQKEEEEE